METEEALASLLDYVSHWYGIDPYRVSLTGISMGGYACLELAKRWPDRFAYVAPVAAHYEFDLESLANALATSTVPLWFFHATNDLICPFEPIKRLVCMIRAKRRVARNPAGIHLTSWEDTLTACGHASDVVAYKEHGSELFQWLLNKHRHR
eukprot:gnl/MRDRNA2_/MRDRNA2_134644_c0_seq1.p1 gnl/MRDRNA2_/MRDRNA2_134644_c0~~gnl/MRDRNA2_/MRDRNA2_134644_c0_seq1.p1  ORF type:complete len:172 (+),score=22.96 gnl/MRDRNA2_/MRDRNA2_134644_c0_seq1:63-518(+)